MDNKQANKLFEDNMKLVPYVVRKKFPNCVLDDDILQIGYIGLWKACLRFDDSKGYKISSYAVPFIFHEIVYYFRKIYSVTRNPGESVVHFDDDFDVGEGDEKSFKEFLESEKDVIVCINFNEIESIYKNMLKLYIAGYTQQEIANELNISQSLVSKETKKLKKLIKNNIIEI